MLRPVTVVVPSNYVGVAARRRLAAGGGLIGVTFVTAYRLAELLGRRRLAAEGRRPVSNPVLLVAVQEELQRDAGVFAEVRRHPATEEALLAAHKQLADLSPAALGALAGASRQARAVVELHQRVKAPAVGVVRRGRPARARPPPSRPASTPWPPGSATSIVLPAAGSQPPRRRAPRRAGRRDTPVTVLAGLTGCADADAGVACAPSARLGWSGTIDHDGAAAPSATPPEPPRHLRVGQRTRRCEPPWKPSSGGPRRHAARPHRHRPRRPRSPGRSGAPPPQAAELPWNGAAPDRLAARVAGRTLLRLLGAGRRRPPLRHDVFAVLAGAPLRRPRRRPRARGGVGAALARGRPGRDEPGRVARPLDPTWPTTKQEVAAARLGRRPRGGGPAAAARRRASARAAGLRARPRSTGSTVLARPNVAGTSWPPPAPRLLSDYLGDDARPGHVAGGRAGRGRPGGGGPRPPEPASTPWRPATDFERFARALALELDADLGRRGRFGDGVLVGPLSLALGLDLDAGRRRRPGRGRAAHQTPRRSPAPRPRSPGRGPRAARGRRSPGPRAPPAPGRRRRRPVGRAHLPPGRPPPHHRARGLPVAARARRRPHGRRWWSDELLAGPRSPGSPTSRRSRPRCGQAGGTPCRPPSRWPGSPRRGRGHPLTGDSPYQLARRLLTARVQPRLQPLRRPTWPAPQSLPGRRAARSSRRPGSRPGPAARTPTSSATCSASNPSRTRRPSCGSARSSRVRSSTPCSSGTSPSASSRARPAGSADLDALRRHTELAFGQAERRGVTGRPLLWRLQHDRARARTSSPSPRPTPPAAGRTRPSRSPPSSGSASPTARPTSRWADGRTLRFRGSIDRVDRAGDEQPRRHRLQVLVHPQVRGPGGRTTRRPTARSCSSRSTPSPPATVFDRRPAAPPGPWPATPSPGPTATASCPAPKEIEVDDAVLDGLARTRSSVIVDGIEQGHFPARPGEDLSRYTGYVACPACDPDDLGTTDLRRRWEQLATAPELAPLRAPARPRRTWTRHRRPPRTDGDG